MAARDRIAVGLENPLFAPRASKVSVQSLCPFCGSNIEPSLAAPCCDQWLEIATENAEQARRTDHALHVAESMTAAAERLNRASQLLVMLLAAAVIAMFVSLSMQSRIVTDESAHLLDVALAKPVVQRQPAEPKPAPAVNESAPAPVAAPSTAPVHSSSDPAPQAAAPTEAIQPHESAEDEAAVEWSPELREKWSHLNRMMSRTAVRALLGDPNWIDARSTPHIEYWLYKDPTIRGEGWIAFFDGGGPVWKWSP